MEFRGRCRLTVTGQCSDGAPRRAALRRICLPPVSAAGQSPGGDQLGRRAACPNSANTLRPRGRPQPAKAVTSLAPETSNNYSIGVELAPQIDFLRGFDLQATCYSVKINNILQGFNSDQRSAIVSNPIATVPLYFPERSRLPGCGRTPMPTACAPFEKMVACCACSIAGSHCGHQPGVKRLLAR